MRRPAGPLAGIAAGFAAWPLALALLLAGLGLSACGFQPLYRAEGGARQAASVRTMAAIDIAPIPDRAGQVLRNALRDRLAPRGRPAQARYRLDISLNESQADIVILRDSTSTFSKYTAEARWALTDLETRAAVLRGDSRRITSFPIPESEFAELEAQKDARDRALAQIADDIHLRLGLFFEGGS